MISQEEYLALVHEMVKVAIPEELMAFELSGTYISGQLFENGTTEGGGSGGVTEFQFLDGATELLNFVGLMIGTFEGIWKVIERIRKKRAQVADEEIVKQWRDYLRERGVENALADDVVARFRSDVITLARHSSAA